MQGVLVSILVALLVEVVDISMGLLIGILAAYYGGWIDQVLARFTDVVFSFPSIMFAVLLIGVFGSGANSAFSNIPILGANGNARLVLASIALAFVAWPLMARYVRAQTLQLKEQQFIEAARTSGASDFKIITRHIVPNLISLVFIAATLNIATTIIGEAGLSLLGLGVTEPGSSLGLMISDALEVTDSHPWEVLVPTIVLAIIVLAISFIGDALRDAFDPRSRG
jgi:peptide/nickel transport system permease protein